ncbi:MAG: hypothetical protein A2152_01320 [Candidatus Levybacteria bacterium RBG_16_35_6]|nr:MAG: hypothetical protein A2152_01320 [Candidatus Levybacteria bacterium RBG_16_35_6]
MEDIERRIKIIEERNSKVEGDKAWETSFFRRFLIALFTYLAIALYLLIIKVENPWINAIVPSIAFLLSTLTLPFFKQIWTKYFYQNYLR